MGLKCIIIQVYWGLPNVKIRPIMGLKSSKVGEDGTGKKLKSDL